MKNRSLHPLLIAVVAAAPLAPAQTVLAPPAAGEGDSNVVVLSPFVVQSAGEETGYLAANTLAGTRLNTSLRDVGAAVSVYTEDFLADIGVRKLEDILTYTTSTEGSGFNGNFAGITGESPDAARDDPSRLNRVRSLATATRTRDYFPTDIPSDTYNFGSLTVSRGPNAALSGVGSAGGVIDSALRQAAFRDQYEAVLTVGSYGTHREELHVNEEVVPGRVAFRADLLNEREGFRQEPAYERDQRAFLATSVRLRDARKESLLGSTTLRANYEVGAIEGVPPNLFPPLLSVQSWFGNANPNFDKWYVNGATQQYFGGTGVSISPTDIVLGFPLFRNWALVFADPNSTEPTVGFTAPDLAPVQGFMGVIPAGAQGPGGTLRGTGDVNRLRAGYSRTRLLDRNIFDFYNQLFTGAQDFRTQDFDAFDVRLEQLLLGGEAGIELAFNQQTFERWRDMAFGGGDEEIFIDVNRFLSVRSDAFPNGIPNPNFGRPFVNSRNIFRDQTFATERSAYQVTAFWRHDFTRSSARWARLLGRHTLSGLLFRTDIATENKGYGATWDTAGQLNPRTIIANPPGAFATQVNAWFYLGPSLANASSLADLKLSPVTAARPVPGQTYTLRVYDPVSRTFVTGTSRPLRILNQFTRQEEEVSSGALTLQSHWFSDHIVTLAGWRRDEAEAFTSIDLPRLSDGNLDLSQLSLRPAVAQAADSWTKSVVARYPEAWLGELPLRSELRAYWNRSENFNPVGQRRNIWNEELGSPSAETEEAGVMLSLLDGKIDLRVNRFETAIKDDTVPDVTNPYFYMSLMVTRMTGAHQAGLDPRNFGYIHPSFVTFEDVARAFFEAIPERLRRNMGPDKNFNPRFVGTGSSFTWEPANIVNLASVSDTVSKGLEFEVVLNPTRNWRIALNAAKNEAVKADVAAEELAAANEWIRNVQTLYDGALSRGWNNPPTSSRDPVTDYRNEWVFSIETANALSGTVTPEIRKWRFNVVTRYEFSEGLLKGLSFGGALRWQDKIAIGYPIVRDANNREVADLANPYYGPDELGLDVGIGYQRRLKLWGRPIDWKVGLNVRNLNASDDIIPVKANANGTYGTVRVPPERSWTLSNSFRF